MSQHEKLMLRIMTGQSDANIPFSSLRGLLVHRGLKNAFVATTTIFTKADVEEIINLQPRGAKAKPYQVKQVRNIILTYKLGGGTHG